MDQTIMALGTLASGLSPKAVSAFYTTSNLLNAESDGFQ